MMDYFLVTAFWSHWGLVRNAFIIPKIAVVATGIILCGLWNKVPKRALVFLGVVAVSTLLSINPELSLKGRPSEWQYGLMACVIYVSLLAFPAAGKRPWLAWAGVALSVHALIQRFGWDPGMPLFVLPSGHRAVAYIGSPVDLGALLAMSASVVPLGLLPVVFGGLWATGSRAAIGAALVSLIPRKKWRLIAATGVVLLGVAWVFRPWAPAKDRVRAVMWEMAYHQAKATPWFGTGPDTFLEVFLFNREKIIPIVGDHYYQGHPHNDLLEAACTLGGIGLLAYLWLVIPWLGNPSLLALFIITKFDPVSFEVICAAALIAGSLENRP